MRFTVGLLAALLVPVIATPATAEPEIVAAWKGVALDRCLAGISAGEPVPVDDLQEVPPGTIFDTNPHSSDGAWRDPTGWFVIDLLETDKDGEKLVGCWVSFRPNGPGGALAAGVVVGAFADFVSRALDEGSFEERPVCDEQGFFQLIARIDGVVPIRTGSTGPIGVSILGFMPDEPAGIFEFGVMENPQSDDGCEGGSLSFDAPWLARTPEAPGAEGSD